MRIEIRSHEVVNSTSRLSEGDFARLRAEIGSLGSRFLMKSIVLPEGISTDFPSMDGSYWFRIGIREKNRGLECV